MARLVRVETADGRFFCIARVADNFGTRGIGLLATKSLGLEDGLLIKPCTSVHTWFMRYPIDVLYLRTDGTIVKTATLKPWRFSFGGKGTKSVLEVAAGQVETFDLKPGEKIRLIDRAQDAGESP